MTAPAEYPCRYCPRVFASAQAVRAHVRFCEGRRARSASPEVHPEAEAVPRHMPAPPASSAEPAGRPAQPPDDDVADLAAITRWVETFHRKTWNDTFELLGLPPPYPEDEP